MAKRSVAYVWIMLPSTSRITALQRLQRGLSTVELVHTPHERWPLPHTGLLPVHGRRQHSLRIAVLDSSFNPPTLAHLALANSALPHYSDIPMNTSGLPSSKECEYDARLLLLSVRNADKSLKPSDATYIQRLEMMGLLTRDIVVNDKRSPSIYDANVAVAIIDEPTFVGKSATLLSFLRQRFALLMSSPPPDTPSDDELFAFIPIPQLIFLQGFDTLERLLSPQYYSSEEAMLHSLRHFFSSHGDDSRVVCARRGMQEQRCHSNRSEREQHVLSSVKEFVESERIVMIDIGKDEQCFSSSEIREKIARGNCNWRNMTTPHIANYIVEQRLYQESDPST